MRKHFLKSWLGIWLINGLILNPCWASVNFDGTDDYLSVGDVASLDFGAGNFSVSFWAIHPTELTDSQTIIGKQDTGSGWYIYLDSSANDSYTFWNRVDSSSTHSNEAGGQNMDDGNWHHVVFTRNGTTGNIYINGVDRTSDANNIGANVNSAGDNCEIARRKLGATDDRYWNGQINEVAIWNVVLTASEIQLLASSRIKRIPLQIQPSSLVSYWPLDDQPDGTSGDGDTFRDIGGNNSNNGTGNDGANNTGLTAKAEEVLSYPWDTIYVHAEAAAGGAGTILNGVECRSVIIY